MQLKDFDTNKNFEEKKVLLSANWLTMAEDNSVQWGAEDKGDLIEICLQPLLGKIRQPGATSALSTLLRYWGLLNKDYIVSPLARALSNGDINYNEYILLILSKQRAFFNGQPKCSFLEIIIKYLMSNGYIISKECVSNKFKKFEDINLNLNLNLNDNFREDIVFNLLKQLPIFEVSEDNRKLECTDTGRSFVLELNKILPYTISLSTNDDKYDYYGRWKEGLYEKLNLINGKKFSHLFPNLFNGNFVKYTGNILPTIFFGPPGTGKTLKLIKEYKENFPADCSFFTTFHQSFTYEDFIEGLRPKLNESNVEYYIEKGVFYKACLKASHLAGYSNMHEVLNDSVENRKYKFQNALENGSIVLLCIDELNRGNVASIFGELISLIEPTKRLGSSEEMIIYLPYSKELFGVPANLVLVATLNTADRSVIALDAALRRRFRFIEIEPSYDVTFKFLFAKELMRSINRRIRVLKGKEYQLGHSYFMFCSNYTELFEILIHNIIPYLEDIFPSRSKYVVTVLNQFNFGEDFLFVEEDILGDAIEEDFEEGTLITLSPRCTDIQSLPSSYIEFVLKSII